MKNARRISYYIFVAAILIIFNRTNVNAETSYFPLVTANAVYYVNLHDGGNLARVSCLTTSNTVQETNIDHSLVTSELSWYKLEDVFDTVQYYLGYDSVKYGFQTEACLQYFKNYIETSKILDSGKIDPSKEPSVDCKYFRAESGLTDVKISDTFEISTILTKLNFYEPGTYLIKRQNDSYLFIVCENHQFTQVSKEPASCLDGGLGYNATQCTSCGYVTRIVNTYKHTWSDWVVNGTICHRECLICGFPEYGYTISEGSQNSESTASTTISKVYGLKLKTAKKAIKVTWKKVSDVTGYEIIYSTSKKFKNAKVLYVGSDSASVNIKKLKAKKNYYVKVRAYKTLAGNNYYGTYSKTLKKKTK